MSKKGRKKVATINRIVRIIKEDAAIRASEGEEYYSSTAVKRTALAMQKADAMATLSRQSLAEDDDPFLQWYETYGLLLPPYGFHDLWRIYEESDCLQSAIESIVTNCERPHDFEFIGDDKTEKTTDANKAVKRSLRDFFSRVNEKESFLDIRIPQRRDKEITNFGAFEIINDTDFKPDRMYYVPAVNLRMTRLDEYETPITCMMPRNGKLIAAQLGRKFRRFAQISPVRGDLPLVWFKEFGDPRLLDNRTGQYVTRADGSFVMDADDPKYEHRANSLFRFHEQLGGQHYGFPGWVSVLMDLRGRYQAKFLNWDALENGNTPRGVWSAKGGKITATSKKELDNAFREWRDPTCRNRPYFLDIEGDLSVDLNRGGTKVQSELTYIPINQGEQDLMFRNYMDETEKAVRKLMRIPGLFVGALDGLTNAVAYASAEVAESQVFGPRRDAFDERISVELIQNALGIYQWRLKTLPCSIGDKEVYYRALNILARYTGSINQITEVGNKLMGTDWSLHEGAVYDEPANLTQTMAAQGRLDHEDGKGFVFTAAPAATPQGGGFLGNIMGGADKTGPDNNTEQQIDGQQTDGQKPNGQQPGDQATATDTSQTDGATKDEAAAQYPMSLDTALFDLLQKIEDTYYEPPSEEEIVRAI